MKHFVAKNTGRTFILRMERGDLLREKIAELCQNERVHDAVVLSGIATFDIAILVSFCFQNNLRLIRRVLARTCTFGDA